VSPITRSLAPTLRGGLTRTGFRTAHWTACSTRVRVAWRNSHLCRRDESERGVVSSERLLRVETQPRLSFTREQVQGPPRSPRTPYHVQQCGWPADIQAGRCPICRSSSRTYYTRPHLTLVLAGISCRSAVWWLSWPESISKPFHGRPHTRRPVSARERPGQLEQRVLAVRLKSQTSASAVCVYSPAGRPRAPA